MSAATPDQVVAIINLRAPFFSTTSNLSDLASLALTFVGRPFRDKQAYASAMLVCHWLAMQASGAAKGGSSGPVTEVREGLLQKQFAGPKGSYDEFLSQSVWGLEFENVRRGVIFAGRTAAVGVC